MAARSGGNSIPGNNGLSYGGGGAGGCTSNSATNVAGGSGQPGLIRITEYISA